MFGEDQGKGDRKLGGEMVGGTKMGTGSQTRVVTSVSLSQFLV